MLKTVIAAGLLSQTTATEFGLDALQSRFVSWMKEFKKEYKKEDLFGRFDTFVSNVKMIEEHNAKKLGWTMAINEFADLSWEEFKAQKVGGFRPDLMANEKTGGLMAKLGGNGNGNITAASSRRLLSDNAPPTSVDWRTEGAVTPVKNQGQCGSCWAFSTVGAIESACFIASHNLTSMSEQQLVDCSGSFGNQGCNGGLMDNGFKYVEKNPLCTEAGYPYTAQDGTCKVKSCSPISFCVVTGYTDVTSGSEEALAAAVVKEPVSVAIEADQSSFQFYSGGVMSGPCGKQLDHGVLVVGYGVDSGTDYWIVKNSWGASWGEQGYIRIERGSDLCGIADAASYPQVKSVGSN